MLAPLDTLSREELEAIASEPYESRGILHSEMALVIDTARRLGVEVFVESGRARGQSTYLLAKHLPDVEIYSIESESGHPDEAFARERLRQFSNVNLLIGDGAQGAIAFCMKSSPRRTAVLVDGPKGFNALCTVKLCLRFSHVRAGFVHDMRNGHQIRTIASAMLPGPSYSDEADHVAAYSWMDEKARAANGPREYTLGMFISDKK